MFKFVDEDIKKSINKKMMCLDTYYKKTNIYNYDTLTTDSNGNKGLNIQFIEKTKYVNESVEDYHKLKSTQTMGTVEIKNLHTCNEAIEEYMENSTLKTNQYNTYVNKYVKGKTIEIQLYNMYATNKNKHDQRIELSIFDFLNL